MKKTLFIIFKACAGIFVARWILRAFVLQCFVFPSTSMMPAFSIGDRFLVSKIYAKLNLYSPKYADIIAFKYPEDPSTIFVKRVIGLPGDSIEIINGVVYVNGKAVFEDYAKNKDDYTMPMITVPEKSYFCMGDNRPHSNDSRFWGFVPQSYIVGPVFFRYWPPIAIGVIR